VLTAATLLTACSSAPTIGTTSTFPLQTATRGEFFSPTKNISCEIDDTSTIRQVFCETISPPRSVTMTVVGSLTQCAGQQCLGNAGEDTPTLPYGSVTGTGPFRCTSTSQGVRCTVTSGRGFEIAAAGVTPLD
jgi:hypothetical protein